MSDAFRTLAWDTYFCGVVTMNLHPGMNRENVQKRTIAECAQIADEMMAEHDKRFGEPQRET